MTKKKYPKYSVLMSVYAQENPKWLEISIKSILEQTVKPDEFVLVEDGPLTKELNDVIKKYATENKKLFKVIKLKKNVGLGPALKVGIEECRNELIARMDSDDYSIPERIEKQLKILEKNPKLDIIGSTVNEFEDDIENIISYVSLPEKHEDIIKFAKKRCPFRHPSLLYKKSAVLKAGNYREYHLCEDYDLYTRMLQNGSKSYNIQQPLTYMRIDKNFYKRRGGIKYLKSIKKFKKEQVKTGFFTKRDYIISIIPHIAACLMPNKLRDWTYRNLLRKKTLAIELNDLPIRILHIVPNMQAGGLESLIMNWYREIDHDKIQFDFLVHYKKRCFFDDEIEKYGGKIHRLDLRDNNRIIKYMRDINRFYKMHPEYKIVHCHMNSIGFIHLMIAKKNGVKIRIAHSHNSSTEDTIKGRIKAIMMRPVRFASTHNFACSTEAGKYLFKSQPFEIVHNAIDTRKFQFDAKKRTAYRKKHHLSDNLVIGHIGRFEKQKNHEYIINIFNEIHKTQPNSKLLLAGTGLLLPDIKQLVHELKLDESVEFLGVIDNADEFYQGIDIFILPSLFEGLPVTGIEAQASGLPCFFSDRVTQEVRICNDNVFFLSIDESPQKWSKSISKNLPSKRTSEIKKEYDIKYAVNKLTKFYTNPVKIIGEKS